MYISRIYGLTEIAISFFAYAYNLEICLCSLLDIFVCTTLMLELKLFLAVVTLLRLVEQKLL